jgi:predicted nicotinamide N-methyase
VTSADLGSKITRLTEQRAVSLVPELQLCLIPTGQTFEEFRSSVATFAGAAPPYWAVAWPGGQALARYLLDVQSVVAKRLVADVGAGGGIAAIAASRAGAASVVCVDCDRVALDAAALNAGRNGAFVEALHGDLSTVERLSPEVVLAADLWYEPLLARHATSVLRRMAARGVTVLAGDPGRAAFMRLRVERLASYRVQASEEFEQARSVVASVWRMIA